MRFRVWWSPPYGRTRHACSSATSIFAFVRSSIFFMKGLADNHPPPHLEMHERIVADWAGREITYVKGLSISAAFACLPEARHCTEFWLKALYTRPSAGVGSRAR